MSDTSQNIVDKLTVKLVQIAVGQVAGTVFLAILEAALVVDPLEMEEECAVAVRLAVYAGPHVGDLRVLLDVLGVESDGFVLVGLKELLDSANKVLLADEFLVGQGLRPGFAGAVPNQVVQFLDVIFNGRKNLKLNQSFLLIYLIILNLEAFLVIKGHVVGNGE